MPGLATETGAGLTGIVDAVGFTEETVAGGVALNGLIFNFFFRLLFGYRECCTPA